MLNECHVDVHLCLYKDLSHLENQELNSQEYNADD